MALYIHSVLNHFIFSRYIKANGGLDTEASYPYKAKDEKCRFKKADVGATDTGKL